MRRIHKTHQWFMRLPYGLRDRPAWVFIGFLVALVGASYLFGFSRSIIVQAVGVNGLRAWGAILMIAGVNVCYATVTARHALELLSLRILALCIFVYCGWLLTVVDIRNAVMTLMFAAGLVTSALIRVASLKLLFNLADRERHDS